MGATVCRTFNGLFSVVIDSWWLFIQVISPISVMVDADFGNQRLI